MPYIGTENRPKLDALMTPLIDHVRSLPMEDQDGALNYTITRVLLSTYPPKYFNYNRALGLLSAVTQEFYRVVVGPYEDEKIRQNGPVVPAGEQR